MASTCSGVRRCKKVNINLRQVQKLSRGSGPRASVSPAMARWKAWEWALTGAGNKTATR